MIKEAYVSFETAKLLKKKGFNEPCFAYYSEYVDNWQRLKIWRGRRGTPKTYDTVKNDGYVLVPTHQTACAWMREKNLNICMMIVPWKGKPYWAYSIYTVKEPFSIDYVDGRDDDTPYFETYEDAVEAAIKYVLENLI